jgi:hypothetical protein
MDKLEQERLVADAIILERAVRVLERMYRRAALADMPLKTDTLLTLLRDLARVSRQQAEKEN